MAQNIEWKLKSQEVITNRERDDTDMDMLIRHETMRRIQAESDLIKALDLLQMLYAKHFISEGEVESVMKTKSFLLEFGYDTNVAFGTSENVESAIETNAIKERKIGQPYPIKFSNNSDKTIKISGYLSTLKAEYLVPNISWAEVIEYFKTDSIRSVIGAIQLKSNDFNTIANGFEYINPEIITAYWDIGKIKTKLIPEKDQIVKYKNNEVIYAHPLKIDLLLCRNLFLEFDLNPNCYLIFELFPLK